MKQKYLFALVGLTATGLILAGCQFMEPSAPSPTAASGTVATTAVAVLSREPEPSPTSPLTVWPVRTVTPGLALRSPTPLQTAVPSPTAQPAQTAVPTATARPVTATAPSPPPGGSNNGMVILAFADAKEGAYSVAYQAMRTRGVRGLLYINVEPVEQRLPGRLTPEQVDELNAAGWDVASHGYTHDDPTQMTSQQLTQHLQGAQQWLLGRGYTRGARHYGPPSNNCDQGTLDAALKYYDTVWCREFSKLPAGYLFGVGACGNNTGWEKIQSAFDKLVGQPDKVLRCSFHDLVSENPTGNQADLDRINTILDYLEAKKIEVVTLSDLLDGTIP